MVFSVDREEALGVLDYLVKFICFIFWLHFDEHLLICNASMSTLGSRATGVRGHETNALGDHFVLIFEYVEKLRGINILDRTYYWDFEFRMI